MQIESILNHIKQRNFAPIYFLMGEEPYFIDLITRQLEETVLTEAEKSFNQTVVYGKETDLSSIIGLAKQFPMNAEHTLIIVKEAQHLSSTIDRLNAYAENPAPHTVLVINYKYKKLDKRKTLTKTLYRKAVLFESKKLYENKIPEWIAQYLSTKNISIEPKASHLLVEFIGADLSRIVNELDKLSLLISNKITTDDVVHNIGISKEYNHFELQKALAKKERLKVHRIIYYFGKNSKDHPLVVTLSVLYNYFSNLLIYHSLKDKNRENAARELRINPYFVGDYQVAAGNYPLRKTVQIISYLREADLKSKGVGAGNLPQMEILKELIFKILH